MSERIIERIQKLLTLSRSSNVHEAQAAAMKAQELMQKYKIEQADIEVKTGVEDIEVESFDYSTYVSLWKRDLAFALARGFFCKAVHTPHGDETGGRSWIHLLGKPVDTEVVRTMFVYLCRELKRLAQEGFAHYITRAVAFRFPERPAEWKNGFYAGAVWGIDGRLRERLRGFVNEHALATAIVRITTDAIDRKIEMQFRALKQAPMGEPVRAYAGWVAGIQAASTIPLDPRKKTLPRYST